MQCEPQKEHQWLQKFLGAWTFESSCSMGPDQPPGKFTGSEKVRPFGDLWIQCEGQGEMPGGGIGQMLMTLGYDPAKKQYTGTWIGTMMTHLWVYEGQLDPTGKILTLSADGPSFTDEKKTAKYQDVIEFKSDDHRVLTSRTQDETGKWNEFMRGDYRRTK
ncbi:MAG: DUF1579 domain-containing protein [Pyrinomonadaceae bacterium]|nr:DUF1579 domain-containing protein [Phycisphaerales bacterium]